MSEDDYERRLRILEKEQAQDTVRWKHQHDWNREMKEAHLHLVNTIDTKVAELHEKHNGLAVKLASLAALAAAGGTTAAQLLL